MSCRYPLPSQRIIQSEWHSDYIVALTIPVLKLPNQRSPSAIEARLIRAIDLAVAASSTPSDVASVVRTPMTDGQRTIVWYLRNGSPSGLASLYSGEGPHYSLGPNLRHCLRGRMGHLLPQPLRSARRASVMEAEISWCCHMMGKCWRLNAVQTSI